MNITRKKLVRGGTPKFTATRTINEMILPCPFALMQKNEKIKAVNPWRRTRFHRGILSMVHLDLKPISKDLTGMKESLSRFNRCPYSRQRFKADRFNLL